MSFIKEILNINPRSIDLVTEIPYDLSYEFKLIDKFGTTLDIADSNIVDTSGKSPATNKTIMFGDLASPDEADLLIVDETYTLQIFKNLAFVEEFVFTVKELPLIERPRIVTFGSRLIALVFEYPVKHLFATQEVGVSTGNFASSNFYIQYFGEDLNSSMDAEPNWKGFLYTEHSSATGPDEPFTLVDSSDEKALFIQANLKSLPVDENHVFEINSSRIINHLSDTDVLQDYFGRDIPITQTDFAIKSFDMAAKPTGVEFISLTEAIVTFDKEVCNLKAYETLPVLSLNGTPLTAFNKIDFSLSLKSLIVSTTNPDAHVPAYESANVEVNSLIDASGFDTKKTIFTVSIVDVAPKILSVKQIIEGATAGKTELEVLFDMPLNQASAEAIENYIVTSADGDDTNPLTESAQLVDPNKVKLTFDELQTGDYNLFVSNVENSSGTPMEETTVPFSVIDLSAPEIIEIFAAATDASLPNSVVAIFNDEMTNDGIHSFSLTSNYKFDGALIPSFITTNVYKNNTMLRFNYSNEGADLVGKNLKPGYVGLKEIHYLTNVSGNIYPVCNNEKTVTLVDPIDVANDLEAKAIDKFTVVMSIKSIVDSKKMFDPDSLNVNDFVFTADAVEVLPVSVSVDETFKVVTFKFTEEFNSADVLTVKTANPVLSSSDIIGRLLSSDTAIATVTNELPSEALSASPLMIDFNRQPQAIDVGVLFSTSLQYAEPSDFSVTLGDEKIYVHEIVIDQNNPKVLIFCCYSFSGLNPEFDKLTISTVKDASRLSTFDTHGNKISPFSIVSDSFNISDFKFTEETPSDFLDSTFYVVGDKPFKFFETTSVPATVASVTEETTLSLDDLNLSLFTASTIPHIPGEGKNLIKIVTTETLITPTPGNVYVNVSLSNDRKTVMLNLQTEDLTPMPFDHSKIVYATFMPYALDLIAEDYTILNLYSCPTINL